MEELQRARCRGFDRPQVGELGFVVGVADRRVHGQAFLEQSLDHPPGHIAGGSGDTNREISVDFEFGHGDVLAPPAWAFPRASPPSTTANAQSDHATPRSGHARVRVIAPRWRRRPATSSAPVFEHREELLPSRDATGRGRVGEVTSQPVVQLIATLRSPRSAPRATRPRTPDPRTPFCADPGLAAASRLPLDTPAPVAT